MNVAEGIPLAALTTLKVGGPATIVAECKSVDDVKAAIALARDRGLPWYVLGGGSNILAADSGYVGVIIHFTPTAHTTGISLEEVEGKTLAIADAYILWDAFVQATAERDLWGTENLAGIPGTVGAAPIQNIGAYGAEVKDTLAWVEVLHTDTLEIEQIPNDACGFGYRDSRFKHDKSLIILRVAFALSREGHANTSYKDLAQRVEEGASVATPKQAAALVRDIRSKKFPNLAACGTAGSFFKNPRITKDAFEELKQKFPELPGFVASESEMKVPLAWILDNVLNLRGYTKGNVGLFERQPLVLVTTKDATTEEIDIFARDIEARVYEATKITIEREVQSLLTA